MNHPAALPLISLVIPAWNEERYLGRLLESIERARSAFSLGRAAVEVIVADNGSTDATKQIARSFGCKVALAERRCIGAARNAGAALAAGKLLAFADADFQIDKQTLQFIARAMSTPGVLGGGTGLVMERTSWGIRATLGLIMPPLWALGYDGGAWFCRHADFLAVGGFDESLRAGEDLRFLRALRRLGRSRRPRERLLTPLYGAPPGSAAGTGRQFRSQIRQAWRLAPIPARLVALAVAGLGARRSRSLHRDVLVP